VFGLSDVAEAFGEQICQRPESKARQLVVLTRRSITCLSGESSASQMSDYNS
jgi:hypothetical protein